MSIEQVIEDICKIAEEANPQENGDYFDEEGLLCCGKCKTRKQKIITLPTGIEKKVKHLCKCKSEKWEREEAEYKHRKFMEEVERNRRMGLPEIAMRDWTFENAEYENKKLEKAMQRYVENFNEFRKDGKGIVLYGTVGTGKTYASACVVNALIDKGYQCLMTSFTRISNTISGMYEGKQEYLDSLNQFDLLVLDDLGAERNSEYMQEMVFNIIDSRYRTGKPFFITTNLSIEEIKTPSDIGRARIYDLIIERCFPIDVSGKSIRRTKVCNDYQKTKDLLGW